MEQEKQAVIYVVSHKAFDVPEDPLYVPIQVGKEQTGKDLGFLSDDTGDEISALNPYYCELTALYWMWKNDSHEVKGLVHYRRYFCNRKWKILSASDVKALIPQNGMIVAQRGYNLETVQKRYAAHHVLSDLELTRHVLQEQCPSCVPAFDAVMRGHSYCPYNMLIAGDAVLDSYCSWLFAILETVRRELGDQLQARDAYNRRALGFLGERLLNVYLLSHPEIPFAEVPVLNIEGNIRVQKVSSRIKGLLK